MSKPIVFVARQIPEVGIELIRPYADVRLHTGHLPPTRDELLAGVSGCQGILSLLSDRIDTEVFEAAGDQLKVVSNFAVGFNNIDLAEASRRGIAVGNTPEVLTDATADIAVSLLLAVSRRLPECIRAVQRREWKTWEPLGWVGLDLQGKTVGIVGMGRIGQAVARRLHGGWQMKVLYTSRQPKLALEEELGAARVSLDDLLRTSDFVSVHLPLAADTEHVIGARELSLMKPQAVLINTARGEIVDQQALEAALRDRKIFGAGLDVCVPEPLAGDSPLRELEHCLILPHVGSATITARNAMAERSAQNLIAGLQGNALPFPVH